MNVLATKHGPRQSLEAKGKPLGKVGILIVFSFVGLVFATALISVKAATSNSVIEISASSNRLSAVRNSDESNEATFDWSWFKVENPADISFNNTEVFAQKCEEVDDLSTSSVGQTKILDFGTGSYVDINSESINALYCFKAVSTSRNGNQQSADFGGYVVNSFEVIE